MTQLSFAATPFNPLFSQLAMPQAQLLAAAAQIPAFAMPMLLDAFSAAGAMGPWAGAQIPPFMTMPSPASMMPSMSPIAGGGYAQQRVDLAAGQPNNLLARIFNPERREAARMEKVLRSDPFARQAFEQAIGGRIVDFGSKNDGRFTVERFVPNPFAQALGGGGLSPLASQLGGVYQQMNQGILAAGLPGALGAIGFNPFSALALGGFAGMASQLMTGGAPGGFASYNAGVQGMPPLFGQGAASWNPLAQPGKIQGSNAAVEGAHSAQVHSVLSDPSLTMEDKIMLALMLICQKMDDDIKRQTEYLNNLQNQQGNRAGGKKGGGGGVGGVGGGGKAGGKAGGAGGGDGEKSIDLETKKLERMITKRSQLFDTLGKIMERYDQSAKNVIQSMRG